MKVVWGVPLLLLGFLGCIHGAEEGCAKWYIDSKDVCCTECRQGNHAVSQCGPDPKELCKLCKEGTYTSDPSLNFCHRCTQCTGEGEKVKRACTSSSDTECDCKMGYRCGDPKCSFCYKECAKGQQPVTNRTCQECPSGTFSDQIHSKCVPWSTRCPQPDQKIIQPGTAVSNIICHVIPDGENGNTELVMILVMAPVFIIFITLAYILITWSKKMMMLTTMETAPEKPITVSVEDRRLVQQESSCCFPQQEQGSSLESVASLDSKLKLLSV